MISWFTSLYSPISSRTASISIPVNYHYLTLVDVDYNALLLSALHFVGEHDVFALLIGAMGSDLFALEGLCPHYGLYLALVFLLFALFFHLSLPLLELREGLRAILLSHDPQALVDLLQEPSELL